MFFLLLASCLLFNFRPTWSIDISISDVCGVTLSGTCPNRISLKVIGGTSTCAEKVPWNVLIELTSTVFKSPDNGIFPYCGGVLVSEKHVLSAAHCFWSNQNQFGTCPSQYGSFGWQECQTSGCPDSCTRIGPEDIKLHLGLTNRLQRVLKNEFRVEAIDIHPGWDRSQKLNDILAGHDLAVLTLSRSLNMWDKTTVPICLPSPTRDRYLLEQGRAGDVTGFGVVISPRDGDKSFPAEVQTARVLVTSKENCDNFWKIRGNQICAAGSKVIETNSGQGLVADSCNGDSGGGLTATNVDGRSVLLGIISFGETDCGRQGGKPGVYTNVIDHLDWIENIVGRSSQLISRPGSPSTTCISTNGKPCQLPFKFRGNTYTACTTDFDNAGRAWCSTKTDSDGQHVVGENEWGHCPASCPGQVVTNPGNSVGGGSGKDPGSGASAEWGAWSSCSAKCGRGTRTRSNGLCPRTAVGCATSQSEPCDAGSCTGGSSGAAGSEWTGWSACSVTCGRGVQQRRRGNSNVAQTQGCNLRSCPAAPREEEEGGGGSRQDNNDNSPEFQDYTSTWIVGGGDEGKFSIESVQADKNGRICGKEITPLPEDRSSCMGAYIKGRVYVCGGSSGTFEDSLVHSTCFVNSATTPGRGWSLTANMPVNTSNAAHTVHDRKLYVIGGYTRPVCGEKPQVQIFDHDSQSWTTSFAWDPPLPAGAYGSAAAYKDRIYVTGGWYTPSSYTADCKEKLDDDELTTENRKQEYYLDRVQILQPSRVQWSQGPGMNKPRRNHGCAVVDYQGKKGLLVAGGYNSQDYFLNSVEFLDLTGFGGRWIQLPDMVLSRGSRLGIMSVGNLIHVLGGDLETKRSVETLNYQSWRLDRNRLIRKRSYSTFIPNIVTRREC